jgi:hypothetical protein
MGFVLCGYNSGVLFVLVLGGSTQWALCSMVLLVLGSLRIDGARRKVARRHFIIITKEEKKSTFPAIRGPSPEQPERPEIRDEARRPAARLCVVCCVLCGCSYRPPNETENGHGHGSMQLNQQAARQEATSCNKPKAKAKAKAKARGSSPRAKAKQGRTEDR